MRRLAAGPSRPTRRSRRFTDASTVARRVRVVGNFPRATLRRVTTVAGDLSRIAITSSKGVARIRLRVRPGAKRREIGGEHAGALRVAVTAPPEKGRANDEVEALLAQALGLARAQVCVVAGRAGRDKAVTIEGLDAEEIRRRLASHLGDGAL